MKKMRWLVAILVIWLLAFYNLERLGGSVGITSVAYAFVLAMVVITMLVSHLSRVPLWVLLVVPIPIFLVLKAWAGLRVWGAAIPLTVTEMSAIVLTTILARCVSAEVSEFESAVAHITMGQIGKPPEPFSARQGDIYREVRRARNYQRPLMLLAVRVEEESVQVALDRMVKEAQQAMMKQYVLSGISKTLCDELADCNIVAQSSDHFVVLLPEVTPEELPDLIGQLRRAVSEQVGVTLRIGAASLPKDALTFDGLMEKAIGEMDTEPQPSLMPHG
jgi:GGDEF domain-containing protein